MNSGTPTVTIAGDATFSGVSTGCAYTTSGLLTAGVLRVRGDFTQLADDCNRGNTFIATAAHRVVLDGAQPQNVAFQNPTSSRFYDLALDNALGVTGTTNFVVAHDLDLIQRLSNPTGMMITVSGTLTLRATSLLDNQGSMTVGACIEEAGATVSGTDPCP